MYCTTKSEWEASAVTVVYGKLPGQAYNHILAHHMYMYHTCQLSRFPRDSPGIWGSVPVAREIAKMSQDS